MPLQRQDLKAEARSWILVTRFVMGTEPVARCAYGKVLRLLGFEAATRLGLIQVLGADNDLSQPGHICLCAREDKPEGFRFL